MQQKANRRTSRGRFRAVVRVVARVKRCGKSAPADRVTGWLGKPHREQGHAEGTTVFPWRSGPLRGPSGGLHELSGNRHPREMNTLDKTRLIVPLSTLLKPHATQDFRR